MPPRPGRAQIAPPTKALGGSQLLTQSGSYDAMTDVIHRTLDCKSSSFLWRKGEYSKVSKFTYLWGVHTVYVYSMYIMTTR
jgi:hypothetical protein